MSSIQSVLPLQRELFFPTEPQLPNTPPLRAPDHWLFHQLSGKSLGTNWQIQAYTPPNITQASLQVAIDRSLQRTIRLFSNWEPTSEVSQFNATLPGEWPCSPEFWSVIHQSLQLADLTDGAVDPTLGALIEQWGFGVRPAPKSLPTLVEINQAKHCSGWRKLFFNSANQTLTKPDGLMLNLSGIAKGWAVDQLSIALTQTGASVHLVEIGGEFAAKGLKPDLQPWWVALEHVPGYETKQDSWIALVDACLATSGSYRHYHNFDGKPYAHTLNGETGWPVNNSIVAVSVWHRQTMLADAFATALTVMGAEAGLAFANTHQLAARFQVQTDQELRHYDSSAFRAMLDVEV